MRIKIDDLTHPQVLALLSEHLANMAELSPPEQVFAFDVTKLRAPDVTFWTAWDEQLLLGCGALKVLSAHEGEIKSMRTPDSARRRGAGRAILLHIVAQAQERGYRSVSLETGTHPAFHKAHTLYESCGFEYCGPFGHYQANEHSVFMRLMLAK
jgi:putative acetyltransferase